MQHNKPLAQLSCISSDIVFQLHTELQKQTNTYIYVFDLPSNTIDKAWMSILEIIHPVQLFT